MSIEFKAAPAKEAELITATAFFTDDKCTTAPVDDSWGLAKFKELSSFSAVTADGKLSFQKWVDADTPYITALTAAEIHVVKKADGVTSAETAAAATGDALWKLTYTATAKDTLCVKFADKQLLLASGLTRQLMRRLQRKTLRTRKRKRRKMRTPPLVPNPWVLLSPPPPSLLLPPNSETPQQSTQ